MTVISKSHLQYWIDCKSVVERCMGNLELTLRILAKFRDSLGKTMDQLDALAEQEDWRELGKKAHRLRGEAGNLSCWPLQDLARRVEEACESGQPESARSALAQLTNECQSFLQQEFCLSDIT